MSERNFIDIKIFMLTNKTDLFFFKQEWFEYLLIMTRVEYPFLYLKCEFTKYLSYDSCALRQ